MGLLDVWSTWESLCAVTPYILSYVYIGHVVVFTSLLVVAAVGRKLGLRRKYVTWLDSIFQLAAVKLAAEEEVTVCKEEEEDHEEVEDSVVICPEAPRAGTMAASAPGYFSLEDSMPYLAAGMRAVVQDCVTSSFTSEELHTWNMLSRTKGRQDHRLSPQLTVFWLLGCIIRYVFLMPMRVLVLVVSLTNLVVCTSLVGLLPSGNFKKNLNAKVLMWCFDVVAGSLSVVARFHNKENRPSHGIAVANHTSPIDSMVLATDQCYDMVGQKAQGILGVFMNALSKSSTHIWFERSEGRDRSMAAQLIENHAKNKSLPPILIFPEGCCVNNTAILQFKKRAFEIDSDIYPIAIRFDPRYGDAFWWQESFGQYLFSMMTSWAIVCDVWYLPPLRKAENESAIAFANRVKALIAHRGGFVELAWDGFIKLHESTSDEWKKKKITWTRKQQDEFARNLNLENEKGGAKEKDT